MAGALKISNEIYHVMPKTKQKDRLKEMETECSKSHPPCLPKSQSFIQNLHYEQSSPANSNDPESFHCAVGPILAFAQFFGVLPVSGIRRPTPLKMKFVSFSFRTVYAACIIGIVTFMAILAIIDVIKTFALEFAMAAPMAALAYGENMMGLILFFWLSPRWVILQREWRSMEQFIDSNKLERPKLRWRFYAISGPFILVSGCQHILNIWSYSANYWRSGSENATFGNVVQTYCISTHAFILNTVEYNLALGMFIAIITYLLTFVWNFTDVFIMLIATGLTERYKLLNKEVIKFTTTRLRTAIDWFEYREDYAALSYMVKKVDNNIAPLICLSYANNLFTICWQFFNGLSQPNDNPINRGLFFFDSTLLVSRMVTLTLLTSRINDQSKVALSALYTCSSSSYNHETERLIYQLTTDNIAFTGLQFFSVTRNFLLAVTGVIVTYLIVLLQFNMPQ